MTRTSSTSTPTPAAGSTASSRPKAGFALALFLGVHHRGGTQGLLRCQALVRVASVRLMR